LKNLPKEGLGKCVMLMKTVVQ